MMNLKKMSAALVASAMVTSMAVAPAFAATFTYENEANALHTVGLYEGTSKTEFVPNLEAKLDRETGVTMLLRLFGQEDEALLLSDADANTKLAKFTDAAKVSTWARKQVAYAVDKGFVKGIENKGSFSFQPQAALVGKAYASLILQQLGYNGAFNYNDALTALSNAGGMTAVQAVSFDKALLKDDCVGMSYNSLQAKYKADGKTVVKALLDSGDVKKEDLEKAKIPYAVVTSVAALTDVTVDIGGTPKLPATVKATFDNGTTADVAVTWPTVDTTAAGEKTVTGTIANTKVTATVKVKVVPAELRAEAKALGNLKEIAIVYNRPVADEDEAKDKGNYVVKNSVIANAELSADKMTVTLLLEKPVSQQATPAITLKKALGFTDDVKITAPAMKDTAAPTVTAVSAAGNGRIKVTFSEPVQSATVAGNYTIDGKLFGTRTPIQTANTKEVSFDLTTRLSAGAHKMVVKKVSDYANYTVETNETEFTVVEDKVAPTGTVKSATQTEVVIEFSEEVKTMATSDISTNTSATILTDADNKPTLAEDNKTLTVKFKLDQALPTAGGKIKVKNLTDFSGNAVDFEIAVTPTFDTTRPEFKAYTIEDQKDIILEFSEAVIANVGKFELKNADGKVVSTSTTFNYYQEDGKNVNTKLVVKASAVLAAEKHTLTISKVQDNCPLKNEILETTVTLDVDDQTDPEVVANNGIYVDTTNNYMYVTFNEDVDNDTALALTSYTFIKGTQTYKLDSDWSEIELLSDNRTVCIKFDKLTENKDSYLVNDIAYLQIDSVKDLAGNEIASKSYDLSLYKAAPVAPKVVSAKVTDKNTVVLKVDGSINVNTLTPDDFIIKTDAADPAKVTTITAWEAKYDADEKEITLTVNADLSADAKYENNNLILSLQAAGDVDTVSPFEKAIVISTDWEGIDGSITDAYAPEADDTVASAVYTKGVGTVVTIELSENLDNTTINPNATQFTVKADGKAKTATVAYANAVLDGTTVKTKAKLVFTIAEDYTNKDVQVIYFAPAVGGIQDAIKANTLADFDLSKTVTAE